jgi:serine/threonine protein kinase
MTLAAGTKLGRYEIRTKIGEGGMGEVHLAEDTRLHRKVALKVLPPDLASNPDRMRRFEQEATAAAALNHPNIATIHEIGEHDGTHFIAMEFIDGITLRELIHHHQQTDLAKLLRYLQHVSEGLSKAHAAGIVHRDLKPDNIMITREDPGFRTGEADRAKTNVGRRFQRGRNCSDATSLNPGRRSGHGRLYVS